MNNLVRSDHTASTSFSSGSTTSHGSFWVQQDGKDTNCQKTNDGTNDQDCDDDDQHHRTNEANKKSLSPQTEIENIKGHHHDKVEKENNIILIKDDENDFNDATSGDIENHLSAIVENNEGDQQSNSAIRQESSYHSDDGGVRTLPSRFSKMGMSRSIMQAVESSRKNVYKAAEKVGKIANKAHMKLFGEQYSKKESLFVLIAGSIVSLNIGMVNGTTLSGLLSPTGARSSVAGLTTHYTMSALEMADGNWDSYGYNVSLILSYSLGAFIAGLLTPKAQPYRIEPTYGPTMIVGGIFLLTASLLAEYEFQPKFIFYCTSVANGIQNGVASIYTANLIRCGLTGATTDAALALAQLLRGNKQKKWRSILLVLTICNFWAGGFISFWLSRRFLKHTMFFNTILFWMVGISLIVFLVKELGISFQAAIFGTWQWRTVFEQVAEAAGLSTDTATRHEDLLELFEELDEDGSGYIDENELLAGLLKLDVTIKSSQIKILVNSADENNDGFIDRDEWAAMVRKML